MGFSYFPGGLKGCIWNVSAGVEFKCLFATAIDRLRLSRTGMGGGCQGGALGKPSEGYSLRLGRYFGSEYFAYFVNVI